MWFKKQTEPPPLISLKDGIYLETSNTRLRWGSTREEAWAIGHPKHHNMPDDDTRIAWEESMLGGLPCGLLAWLPDQEQLNQVSIWMRPPENTYPKDALYQYCHFFNHLFSHIGYPRHIAASSSFYAPILTWAYDDCFLQLTTGERFGDYTSLEISYKCPPRYKSTHKENENA